MLKHIKKKTVNYPKFDKEELEKSGLLLNLPDGKLPKFKFKDVKDKHALLIMDNGEMLRSFFYSDNGNTCTIPLANPVLIYFHSAQANLRNIYSLKKDLMALFRGTEKVTENSLQLFYGFFGLSSSFVTQLMTALEAFVNQKIPLDYIYQKDEANKFTKTYNKDQIQRWVSLDDKISDILNIVDKKNFAKHYPNRQIHIDNLKDLRDNIVHTKSGVAFENYTELFKKALNFKYNEAIEAVRDFINYYNPNLIEPCPCGVDS